MASGNVLKKSRKGRLVRFECIDLATVRVNDEQRAHSNSVLSISLRFEHFEYLHEGVEGAVRSGSPRNATAIQAIGIKFISCGLSWRKINERSFHALTRCSKRSEINSI